jgi:hypothetical protein
MRLGENTPPPARGVRRQGVNSLLAQVRDLLEQKCDRSAPGKQLFPVKDDLPVAGSFVYFP